jgi:hypothetical protein
MTLQRLLLLIALGFFIGWLLRDDAIEHGPGVLVPESPSQSDAGEARAFDHNGYRIQPLADFHLKARVLGREDYRLDREAELAPMDLALGWGPMSDEAVLQDIDISQGGRWYRWKAKQLPIPRRDIERNSANMHLIPADEWVGDTLDEIREGSLVELRGFLVEVESDDGWRWRSSLTRDDTGARSCQVFFVERVRLLDL